MLFMQLMAISSLVFVPHPAVLRVDSARMSSPSMLFGLGGTKKPATLKPSPPDAETEAPRTKVSGGGTSPMRPTARFPLVKSADPVTPRAISSRIVPTELPVMTKTVIRAVPEGGFELIDSPEAPQGLDYSTFSDGALMTELDVLKAQANWDSWRAQSGAFLR